MVGQIADVSIFLIQESLVPASRVYMCHFYTVQC